MKPRDNDSGLSQEAARQLDDPRVIAALDEYLAALESGQKLDRQEFLSRNADIADALAECLEGIEALHAASSAAHSSSGIGIAHNEWQPGTPLGDYRILREVGRGGMGVVYEAEQLSLGRRIALKVLPFALTLDPRQLQRFKNEARAAAQLHHQNIVPVYAVGSERGVHFYAMQYIEGQSLAEVIHDLRRAGSEEGAVRSEEKKHSPHSSLLTPPSSLPPPPSSLPPPHAASTGPYVIPKEGPAPETVIKPLGAIATSISANSTGFYRTVARLGIQAAQALEHAHDYGVIHRDIKPGNLMVDAHGQLWITDFGLAQFQTDVNLTQSGDLLGTLRYMSPEQAGGQRLAIDHRTDIYSLGATLYELLTLRPPFEGGNRQTLLHQILNDEPRPPRAYKKSIPVELETIVLEALAKAPAERYPTARELADDLSRFLQDQPIRARRTTAVQHVRKWARRHPSIVWAAVILCLLSVAGSLVSAEIIRRNTEDALNREKDALKREQLRAEEAEKDFTLARDAVDGMFQLCEEELSDKPFLDGLRRRLLQDYFLVYYQKLIDQRHDDPAAQAKLSATRARVKEILDNLAELQGLGQFHLLNNPDVARDLLTNDEQLRQIRDLTREMDRQRWESRGLSADERLKHFLNLVRWVQDQAQQILTLEQRRRLRQIDLQFKGPRAFEEQAVIDALHLTASQREQIRAVLAQEFRVAFDCHPPPPGKHAGPRHKEGEPKLPPPGNGFKPPPFDLVGQIEKVLTPEQQKQWRDLIGSPFKKFGRRLPGGPPGLPPP